MNDISHRTYLYGLDREYRIVRYHYIERELLSIKEIKICADLLKRYYPNIAFVYAVDNCYEIYQDCVKTMKIRSVENCVMFKILLEERGLRIV